MIINKIKEIENTLIENISQKAVRTVVTSALETAVFQILELMLEIEEQKEKFVPSNSDMESNYPVVEVGQIWRSKLNETYEKAFWFEIIEIIGNEIVFLSSNISTFSKLKSNLEYFELVTIENIKKGEFLLFIATGKKSKVVRISDNIIFLEHGWIEKNSTEMIPCLPPSKEKEVDFQEKYNLLLCEYQTDLDNMHKKGKDEGYILGYNDSVDFFEKRIETKFIKLGEHYSLNVDGRIE